jgi:hypothetical protein
MSSFGIDTLDKARLDCPNNFTRQHEVRNVKTTETSETNVPFWLKDSVVSLKSQIGMYAFPKHQQP